MEPVKLRFDGCTVELESAEGGYWRRIWDSRGLLIDESSCVGTDPEDLLERHLIQAMRSMVKPAATARGLRKARTA